MHEFGSFALTHLVLNVKWFQIKNKKILLRRFYGTQRLYTLRNMHKQKVCFESYFRGGKLP